MNIQSSANRDKIRVLFIGLKYDYGTPQLGYSYEYTNFYDTLVHMKNIDVTLFPYDEIMRKKGRNAMNSQLINTVNELKPNICLFLLFTDEIKKDTIKNISDAGETTTINWFADDHWRFNEYSRYWAPLFHWVVTTDRSSIEKYHKIGYYNVILSQWGANHFLYKNNNLSYEHDVTFVGKVHSNRKKLINGLKESNIKVECWGNGWPNGRISQNDMIEIFSKSKINLNFTDGSIVFNFKQIGKLLLNRRANDTFRIRPPREMIAHIKILLASRRTQIKGRNFEIPASGGFLLTQYADGLEDYFIPEKEIATFNSIDELFEKIQYYLCNDKEREVIRKAGYERVLREHTYKLRFENIFNIITEG